MNITVYVNGIDITNKILFESFQISDNINNKTNQCNFNLYDCSFIVGNEISVYDGTTLIFGGVIILIDNKISKLRNLYSITCKDYSVYLERKLVTERYVSTTVNDIIADLVSGYATDFTVNNVVCPVTVNSITFNQLTVVDAIQRLAELTNYSWYIDYEKDIHFFPKNSELSPFNLATGDNNFLVNSLSIKEDLSQLKNNVFVVGGETEAEERTEEYVADGDQNQFPLAYKYATKPAVEVNGTPITVGVDGIDLDDDFDCFWSYQQKYIRFKTATKPVLDDVVAITGIPLFPILVKTPSFISIRKYGIYEFKIIDKNIKTRNDAVARGRAELEAYANPIKEGGFSTYRTGLISGQTIIINVGSITGTFTIQSVKLKMRTPYDGEWEVAVSSLRTIGIINFLQKLLRDDEPIDENVMLLKLLDFTDSYGLTDTLTLPTNMTSPPYYYDDAGAIWNFTTWS